MNTAVISALKVAESLNDYWSPKVVGEVDDAYIKVAKLHGEFTWHSHDGEDEMFFVLKGELTIEMENNTVTLNVGDLYVVPRGVRHKPIAMEECHVLLFERKSTLHTGNIVTEQTKSIEEQL